MVLRGEDSAIGGEDATRVMAFVPLERMGEFNRKIDAIRASARRLDLPEWEVDIGEREWRPVRASVEDAGGRTSSQSMQLEGRLVAIIGTAPVLSGWSFLAKIEHDESGNLVKLMGGDKAMPTDWHTCAPNCAHCDLSRQRSTTYMLNNVESNEVKQVGSTCVSDFLGAQYRDPERILSLYDHVMELGSEFGYDPEREFGGVRTAAFGVPPEQLMAAVLKIVQEDSGYISAEKAETLACLGTGDRVRAAFWSRRPIAVVPDAGHLVMAPKVVAWLRDQKEGESLWMRNIAYLADRPGITCKDAGLFASGYVAWNRELQRKLKAEAGVGDWLGQKGDKLSTTAILERHGGFETAYGYKTVLSFRDEEGNGLIWKTQSAPSGLLVGSTYHLSATVKEHDVYKGDRQTEIIRTKVAELELFSFGALPGYKKLARVATPDCMDERGHTPLLKAIWADEVAHARVLLAAGANANQLNQNEIPVLSYVSSPEMARALMAAGARAADITDEWLKDMNKGAVEAVLAARQAAGLIDGDGSPAVVCEGHYSGRVLEVADGIVTQKINRDGATVRHATANLSKDVREGELVEIRYRRHGVGEVGAGIERVTDAGVGR